MKRLQTKQGGGRLAESSNEWEEFLAELDENYSNSTIELHIDSDSGEPSFGIILEGSGSNIPGVSDRGVFYHKDEREYSVGITIGAKDMKRVDTMEWNTKKGDLLRFYVV